MLFCTIRNGMRKLGTKRFERSNAVDELLLLREYELFLSEVEMPIAWPMPGSDFDSRIYRIVNDQPLLLNGLQCASDSMND